MPVVPDKGDKYYALADSAGRSLMRLLSAVLVARLCGPTVYAAYVLCITIEVVATSLPNAINLSPMLSIGPGLPDEHRRGFFARVLQNHFRWSALLAVVGGCVAPMLTDLPLGASTWLAFAGALLATGALNAVRARQQARFCARSAFWADVVGARRACDCGRVA